MRNLVIVVVFMIFAGCTSETDMGKVGGICYPNGTCDSGLICDDGTCYAESDGGVAYEDGEVESDSFVEDDVGNLPVILSVDPNSGSSTYSTIVTFKMKNMWSAYEKVGFDKSKVKFYIDGRIVILDKMYIMQPNKIQIHMPHSPYGNKNSVVELYFKFGDTLTNSVEYTYIKY